MVVISEGTLIIITGHMGNGKTHWGNVITQGASYHGYHTYTNINYFNPDSWDEAKRRGLLDYNVEYVELPSNVHVTNKMSELLLGLTRTTPNLVILDEAMIFAGFDRHGSKILRWFKDFVVQCRKLDTAVILITQVKSQLTKLLREQLEHYEHFCQKKKGTYIIRTYKYYPMDRDNGQRELTKGPVAKQTVIGNYPFDTKSPASLIIDVDMEGFLGDVSCFDSIEIVDHIQDLVDKWRFNVEPKGKKEKGPTKKEIVAEKLILHPEASLEEISVLAGCSTRLVSIVKKESNE